MLDALQSCMPGDLVAVTYIWFKLIVFTGCFMLFFLSTRQQSAQGLKRFKLLLDCHRFLETINCWGEKPLVLGIYADQNDLPR